jgi:hypothetical protein
MNIERREEENTNGCDSEEAVEDISVNASLGGSGIGSSLGSSARGLRSRISATRVDEGIADGLSDDRNGLGGTVVERSLVNGLEAGLLAVVEANTKLDLGDGAFVCRPYELRWRERNIINIPKLPMELEVAVPVAATAESAVAASGEEASEALVLGWF